MWKKQQWAGHKPLPRSGCAGCSLDSKLVFFGGNACSSGENFLSDTYAFDLEEEASTTSSSTSQPVVKCCREIDVQGSSPFAMDRHTAVGHDGEMWVFGGDRGWTLTNKLWKFNARKLEWTDMATQAPPCARRGHTTVKCEGRKSMVLFGGMVMTHVPYYLYGRLVTSNVSVNDIWELFLDPESPRWERRSPVNRPPPPRRGHSAVLFEADAAAPTTRMYVFGGYCEQEESPGVWYNDLWRFILEKGEWQSVACWGDVPRPRVGHAAACTNRGSFIVFGGGSLENNENTLYECHENGLWRRIDPLPGSIPPSPRSYVTFATVGTHLFMHGGCNNDRELDCMYSLSLDFNTLFPRSLKELLAEFIILHNIPYKSPPKIDKLIGAPDVADRSHVNSQCGSRR
eukprot:GGOE01006032.1.p1 GENE.GGOE01006032.1~~GGOE01006032.1.p1  ORF type:complete len:412 (-),score=101.22 GGOE01006032.1:1397-2596(-)